MVLGLNQLFDQLTYSEKKVISSVERVLSEKYGEAFAVDKNTVDYNNPSKRVNLRAHPVDSPESSILVEVYLSSKVMEFNDNYLINEALNKAMNNRLDEMHFYFEGSYDDFGTETEETMKKYNLRELNERNSIEYLQKSDIKIIVFTDMDNKNEQGIIFSQQLYEAIRYLDDLGVEIGSLRLEFPAETNSQRKLTLKDLVQARKQNPKWDSYLGNSVTGCFIFPEIVGTLQDMVSEIEDCDK